MSPCLNEVVFLCVNATALQTLDEVFVPFPPGGPLVYGHNLVTVTDRRVDLHRIPLHDLVPFYSVDFGFWRFVDLGLDRGSKVLVIKDVIRQCSRPLGLARHAACACRAVGSCARQIERERSV